MSNDSRSLWDTLVCCWIFLIVAIHAAVYVRKSYSTLSKSYQRRQHHHQHQHHQHSYCNVTVPPGLKTTALNTAITTSCKEAALCKIGSLEKSMCVCGDTRIQVKSVLGDDYPYAEDSP
mmetsp:Transcript_4120/g.6258  ORF Transcript_4120/g.6258 Transcript_4120/m.6258 type:complete len:119 (+) Transcript_4120:107-463(+)